VLELRFCPQAKARFQPSAAPKTGPAFRLVLFLAFSCAGAAVL